jgi:hypothetical protein
MDNYFNGDFDLIPIRATLDGLTVPTYPSPQDVALAQMAFARVQAITWESAALAWHVEAVKARHCNPMADITGREVMGRVAARLYNLRGW